MDNWAVRNVLGAARQQADELLGSHPELSEVEDIRRRIDERLAQFS
jgi:hypothetical protein